MNKNRIKIQRPRMIYVALAAISCVVSATTLPAVAQSESSSVIVAKQPVQEPSQYKPHVGLLTGISGAEGSYNSGAEYGLTVGYQPYIPFGLGVELSTVYNNVSKGPETQDFRRTKLFAQGSYNFGGQIPIIAQSYVAFAAGPMIEEQNSSTDLVFGIMPSLGFDYPFAMNDGKDLSVGLNARYLVSSSGAADSFGVNAMAKYWF